MITIERVITVDKPIDLVFAYLADFENTNEWDPGTVRTTRTSGNGGIGTTYQNTSSFAGRQTELEYTVEDLQPRKRFRLRGENNSMTSYDTMTFRPVGAGTEVTYIAEFDFQGVARLAAPLLKSQFKKLGDNAEQGMRQQLEKL
ncbi:SRPBCC family protein [Kribbella sp. NPDC051718]|uniref:SRPBCC family protein n=1 Tax=Kribbella sp. NPDC051718 TaxID=3155168 RepID=UPI00343D61F0